jgi:hypothetical protein
MFMNSSTGVGELNMGLGLVCKANAKPNILSLYPPAPSSSGLLTYFAQYFTDFVLYNLSSPRTLYSTDFEFNRLALYRLCDLQTLYSTNFAFYRFCILQTLYSIDLYYTDFVLYKLCIQ